MLRCLVTIVSVALLSGLLDHVQQAQGQREFASARSTGTDWIRTVDGWEPSIVLELDPGSATLPVLHPLLVASFQLIASLFALLAFPAAKAVAEGRTARSW